MEDVAEDYLNELIDRSMNKVVREKHWYQGLKECSVHDLLRDLAISKSTEEGFLQTYGKENSPPSSLALSRGGRRLAIHSDIQSNTFNDCLRRLDKLRSFLMVNTDFRTTIRQNELTSICLGFKLLRVLDLSAATSSELRMPDEIGELIHLRYLSLSTTVFTAHLPASIGNLQRLQTLDLTECSGQLPNTLGKLGQLRHLYGSWTRSNSLPVINTLTNLQTLDYISLDVWLKNDPTTLINLRNLKITEIGSSNERALYESLARLGTNLQSLSLHASDSLSIELGTGCNHLLDLTLECKLLRLPDLLQSSPNLTKLELMNSSLHEDPMPTLERLPNLSYLVLTRACRGRQIICSSNGFPHLNSLKLEITRGIKLERGRRGIEERVESRIQWTIEEGAMPRLDCLTICCMQDWEVPDGLRFLTSLRQLQFVVNLEHFNGRFSKSTGNLEDRLRGEESYKVQHIPSVTFARSSVPAAFSV